MIEGTKNSCKMGRVWAVGLLAVAVSLVSVSCQSQYLDSEADRLSDLLNLKLGSMVAEIGAGDGELTVRIAARIDPNGKIYSTELNSKQLDQIRSQVKKRNLINVKVVQGAVAETLLPSRCCQAIFLRGVYRHFHHFTQLDQMNASLLQSLQPNGLLAMLAIVDFPPKWLLTTFWKVEGVPANQGGYGIKKELLIDELIQAGFQVVRVVDDWDSIHYCVLFRKAI